jgi:hypothetical protein
MTDQNVDQAEFGNGEMGDAHIMDRQQAVEYILAGAGTVTFKNTQSGNHLSFSFGKPSDGNGSSPIFVSLENAPGFDADRRPEWVSNYLGAIWSQARFVTAGKRDSKKRVQTEEAWGEYLAIFNWTWSRLLSGRLPVTVEICHEGSCGRCGRRLTDPQSIERGFGPECAKVLGKGKKSNGRANQIITELGF